MVSFILAFISDRCRSPGKLYQIIEKSARSSARQYKKIRLKPTVNWNPNQTTVFL